MTYVLPSLPPGWPDLRVPERTVEFLLHDGRTHVIYPPAPFVFRALELTPLERVKVVILGQDPYHGPGQAEGLCFSVARGVPPPPSLRNIFRELHADLGIEPPRHGSLVAWAAQGVLLLNSVLTVRAGEPHSHAGRGWEEFTDDVIRRIEHPVVFALWGAHAQRKAAVIDRSHHRIVDAAHPSPLSAYRGFLSSRPFSRIDAALRALGQEPVDWRLPP